MATTTTTDLQRPNAKPYCIKPFSLLLLRFGHFWAVSPSIVSITTDTHRLNFKWRVVLEEEKKCAHPNLNTNQNGNIKKYFAYFCLATFFTSFFFFFCISYSYTSGGYLFALFDITLILFVIPTKLIPINFRSNQCNDLGFIFAFLLFPFCSNKFALPAYHWNGMVEIYFIPNIMPIIQSSRLCVCVCFNLQLVVFCS